MNELIIFDCDGTLVDSELLYNTVIADLLSEAGLPEYTPQVCLGLFTGLTFSNIRSLVEKKHGLDLSESMSSERYIARSHARMDEGLNAIEGANAVLQSVSQTHKICIGSNGERASVIKSLQNTGLYDFFGGNDEHIFTKIQVKNAKPAPDLFLFAAREMGFNPGQCWVIEDSVAGVTAGVAAGMNVIGFTGSSHNPSEQEKKLREAGANYCAAQLIHILDLLSGQKEFRIA